ncbi:hypothetical protein BS732_1770 [Bacillus subtilis MB73/2]|nr:hypothetical protein BS732_1770 [Bacillus subtilis MB73/2]
MIPLGKNIIFTFWLFKPFSFLSAKGNMNEAADEKYLKKRSLK